MKWLTAFAMVFVFTELFGQSVRGLITDVNGEPVVGAVAKPASVNQHAITDKKGIFKIDHLPTGIYEIEFSSVGFQSVKKTIHCRDSNTVVLDILLAEKIYDLPPVVVESVTMTGGLAGLHKAIGSAHYIGQKEIQKFSYTDINRTLRQIPGVNIQEEDGYGLRPNIGLRATGSERSAKITVMEDGILMAPAPYSAPAAYYFPTIGRMESIEIMKGSSQVKYGPFTTGGAINLLSTPIPTSFSGHADFIAGSDGYKMLHANLGNAHKNFAYLVETMQYSADGFKQLDGGGNTGFNKEDYLAKFRVHTNSEAKIYQSLTFKIGQARETSNETYLGLTDEDFVQNPLRRYSASQKDLMKTKQQQLVLTHFASLMPGLDIHTNAYSTTFERNWYKLDKVAGTSIAAILEKPDVYEEELELIKGLSDSFDALAVKANNRSYYARGIQTNIIVHKKTDGLNHKLDLSLRYHQDQIDRFQWVDSYDMESGLMKLHQNGIAGTESNRVETADALSAYIQYKAEWKGWTIVPGIRYENITVQRADYGKEDPARNGTNLKMRSNMVSAFIPGLGWSYRINDAYHIFGGVHKGFAPPGSKEGTLPENSWNYELGWKMQSDHFQTHILGYYNDYSNLLGTDLAATGGTGSHDLFNGGAATAYGLETQVSLDLLGHGNSLNLKLPLSVNYTYTYASFDNSFESEFDAWGSVQAGDLLPYVPKHQIGFGISAEHARFFADVNAKFHTAMRTVAGNNEDTNVPMTDDAFTLDLALNYRLNPSVSAFINVNNATNNIYIVSRRPAGVRPNLPRTFNVGIKANF